MNNASAILLSLPLDDAKIAGLHAGDEVLLSGVMYGARDQAHRLMCESLAKGEALPVDLRGQVIYFVGPSPARPGSVIGAAGPTTSSRMDAFSPALIAAGLKGMIGKGYRGDAVRKALAEHKAVHFAATGGAGALLSERIVRSEVIAYESLGTEALREMEVVDFPVVVAYDSYGKSVYGD